MWVKEERAYLWQLKLYSIVLREIFDIHVLEERHEKKTIAYCVSNGFDCR